MKLSVITRRWFWKTGTLTAVLMALIVISLSLILRFFYYNSARSALAAGYNSMVSRFFSVNAGTTDEDDDPAVTNAWGCTVNEDSTIGK